jgi:hypothetical protein
MRNISERNAVMHGNRHKILPYRRQADVVNGWLKERLDSVLPALMKREGIDMWIVACREGNEDPVFISLMPEPTLYAGRLTILVFTLRDDGGVSRYIVAKRSAAVDFYEHIWYDGADQWALVKKLADDHRPEHIGVNIGETFAYGDGLSVSLYKEMRGGIGKYASSIKSAERLAVGWLETRTDSELAAYGGIVAIAHDVVSEAFSRHVLHPGITTNMDLAWWIRQRYEDLGLKPWFQPTLTIQHEGYSVQDEAVIMPGDLLHSDTGICYLRLCTDNQQHAYVLKPGETDAPEGLKKALRAGMLLQDIIGEEMALGGTGNEILRRSKEKAITQGLTPSVYCHPIGYHGHGAGPTIGLTDEQENVVGRGDYELFNSTCYALESNVTCSIPEWGKQNVKIALEQTVVVKDRRTYFLDGRQTELYLV